MTYEEELKFRQGITLFSDTETRETYLECWEASTKHPDARFCYSDYDDKRFPVTGQEFDWEMFQWLYQCASKMLFSFNAFCIGKLATDLYLGMR